MARLHSLVLEAEPNSRFEAVEQGPGLGVAQRRGLAFLAAGARAFDAFHGDKALPGAEL